jgi:hypothetical protein
MRLSATQSIWSVTPASQQLGIPPVATMIANFKPTITAAAGFGYQPPSSTPAYDPLFPQWMCTTSLPAGLITLGCQNAP